ncbi:MAG: hypothetical protein MZV64_11730 [Ignavibacteriales bacterium]|nr:hypothetical protein [Ignavibacteriales bacterium]
MSAAADRRPARRRSARTPKPPSRSRASCSRAKPMRPRTACSRALRRQRGEARVGGRRRRGEGGDHEPARGRRSPRRRPPSRSTGSPSSC